MFVIVKSCSSKLKVSKIKRYAFLSLVLLGSTAVSPSIGMENPNTETTLIRPNTARTNAKEVSCFLDELYMAKFYDTLAPEAKHLCPLNGMIILNSGVLANVRFHGRYGAPNSKFLCHYQIVTPDGGHASTAHKDSPQDSTTSVIQQLFPSPAGGMVALPGAGSDFFNTIPHAQIAQLLVFYSDLKSKNVDCDTAYKSLHTLFSGWLSLNPGNNKSWKYPKEQIIKLEENWSKSGISLDILAQKYAEIFAGSLYESASYPHCFIESALLALAWKRTLNDKRGKEKIDNMLKVFKDSGHTNKGIHGKESKYNKAEYDHWRIKSLVSGILEDETLKKLILSPSKLIFVTLGYDRYQNTYPKLLGTELATHTFADPDNEGKFKRITFSDCGEAALRDFFNVIFGDFENRSFNLDTLKKVYPKALHKLIDFFEYKQNSFDQINDGIVGRSAWADVVSSLNTPDDPLKISYANPSGLCDIEGIGIDNIYIVLEKLLNAPIYSLYPEELDAEKRRAKIMTHLLGSLSTENCEFTWEVNGESEILENYGVLTILSGDEKLFNWHFGHRHFQFEFYDVHNKHDWRQNNKAILPTLLNSKLNPILKSQLCPFFLRTEEDTNLAELCMDANIDLLPEIVYGMKLNGGAEQQLNTLRRLIRIAPEIICDLAARWLEKFPEDRAINRMVVSFIFNHQDFFNPEIFNKETCPRIYDLYHDTLDPFKAIPINKIRLDYIQDSPYGEILLIGLLNGVGSIKSELQGRRKSRFAMVDLLLKTGDSLPDFSLNDGSGRTLISEAIQGVHDVFDTENETVPINFWNIVNLLIEHGGNDKSLIYYYTKFGEMLSKTAADEEFMSLFPKIIHYDIHVYNRCMELFKTNTDFKNAFEKYFDVNFWVKLVEKGQPEAIETLKVLSQEGNPEASYQLGVLYEEGTFVKRDYRIASSYFLAAADKGNCGAQFKLGQFYHSGMAVEKNYKIALSYFLQAWQNERKDAYDSYEIKKGAFDEIYKLAYYEIYAESALRDIYNISVASAQKNDQKSIYVIKKMAAENDSDALYQNGLLYLNGMHGEEYLQNALSEFIKAAYQGHNGALEAINEMAESGNTDAQFFLGEIYDEGNVVDRDEYNALMWYEKAADNQYECGHSEAQYRLGCIYEKGLLGVDKNQYSALDWYQKSAKRGHSEAQFKLGCIYEKGLLGVEIYIHTSYNYYKQAAYQGHNAALEAINEMAENGNSDAQFFLGEIYDEGEIMDRNECNALMWYEKAANNEYGSGHSEAQFRLGCIYEKGLLGVEKNEVDSLEWYQEAAKNGYSGAQDWLGYIYEKGLLGLEIDVHTSLKYYNQAAEQGNLNAFFKLGIWNFHGKEDVCDQNYEKAFCWLMRAVNKGHQGAQEMIDRIREKAYIGEIRESELMNEMRENGEID